MLLKMVTPPGSKGDAFPSRFDSALHLGADYGEHGELDGTCLLDAQSGQFTELPSTFGASTSAAGLPSNP